MYLVLNAKNYRFRNEERKLFILISPEAQIILIFHMNLSL